MATTIKLKNSVTTTNAPSSLVQGEVAINITDKKVWVGNAATTPIQLLGAGSSASFGALTCTSLTNSGLTSGRVTYASTGGLLADSANFTFNGTTVTMANDASISGLTVGKGGGSVASNTALGLNALAASATGTENTGVGASALSALTTGNYNTAVGRIALQLNTTGSQNTAVGRQALNQNTTGSNNTAIGYTALLYTTADNNTALGFQAGYNNTTGTQNTAVGGAAFQTNTTGSNNTAVGYISLYNNTTGASNTAFGHQALYTNTTGTLNVALGPSASYFNTTGSQNIAIGYEALKANTTASNNVGIGFQAGFSNTTGNQIVLLGKGAGYTNTTGTDNTLLGYNAGYTLTTGGNVAVGSDALSSCSTGSLNTAVGYSAGNAITTGSKNTILGRYTGNQGGLDIRTASNYIVLSDGDGNPRQIIDGSGRALFGATSLLGSRNSQVGIDINGKDDALFIQNYGSGIGWGITMRPSASSSSGDGDCFNFTNTSFTTVGTIKTTPTATAYNTTSDYRLKENVQPMTGALAKVAELKPVTYTWKSNGSAGQGFIAHELQAVVPDAVSGEKDALDKDGNPAYQGVDASFLVATLTAAIKELKAEVDSLKAQLNNGA